MKINWLHINLILVLVLVVFLYRFSSDRNASKRLADLTINITNYNEPLLEESTVNKLLIQNKGSVKNIKKETLDLNSVEKALTDNKFVKTANVYVSVNGLVNAEIDQRRPIARIQTQKPYYLDSDGHTMPLSKNFTARVPLVTGKVNKSDLLDLHTLLTFVNKDEFIKKQLEGISVNDHKYRLHFREFNFIIDFGTVDKYKTKLENFKAFYQKALKDKTLNTYSKVNLQIASQVVCTKK